MVARKYWKSRVKNVQQYEKYCLKIIIKVFKRIIKKTAEQEQQNKDRLKNYEVTVLWERERESDRVTEDRYSHSHDFRSKSALRRRKPGRLEYPENLSLKCPFLCITQRVTCVYSYDSQPRLFLPLYLITTNCIHKISLNISLSLFFSSLSLSLSFFIHTTVKDTPRFLYFHCSVLFFSFFSLSLSLSLFVFFIFYSSSFLCISMAFVTCVLVYFDVFFFILFPIFGSGHTVLGVCVAEDW